MAQLFSRAPIRPLAPPTNNTTSITSERTPRLRHHAQRPLHSKRPFGIAALVICPGSLTRLLAGSFAGENAEYGSLTCLAGWLLTALRLRRKRRCLGFLLLAHETTPSSPLRAPDTQHILRDGSDSAAAQNERPLDRDGEASCTTRTVDQCIAHPPLSQPFHRNIFVAVILRDRSMWRGGRSDSASVGSVGMVAV